MLSASQLFLANGTLRKFFMTGGWLPLSVRVAVDLEFSAFQLLLMGTAIELGVLLGEVPTGVVADVFSRKWSVVTGAVILAGAQLASGLVGEWPQYLATQFVWGVGWTFITGAEIAWVTDEIGSAEEAEPLLLRRGRYGFAAVVAGIIFFGVLSIVLPLTTTLIIAGSLGLAWAAFLAVAMKETAFERSQENHWAAFRDTLVAGGRFVWSTQGLRVLGVVLVVGGIAAETLDRTNVRRLEDLGLSEDASPILVVGAIMLSKAMLGWLVYRFFEDRFAGRRVVRAFSLLLALVGVCVLLLANVPLLALTGVLLVLQGGLLDMTDPLIGTWTNALAPTHVRATVHSFIGQARAVGEILGGVLLGITASLTTLPTAWIVAAGIFILAAGYARTALSSWPA